VRDGGEGEKERERGRQDGTDLNALVVVILYSTIAVVLAP
jgi:hypothetical protein